MTKSDVSLMVLTLAGTVLLIGACLKARQRLGKVRGLGYKAVEILCIGTFSWLGLTSVLGQIGWTFDMQNETPRVVQLFLFGIGLVLLVAFSPLGRALSKGLKMEELVGFQAFRLPLEFVLYGLYLDGLIPQRLTFLGQNWDIVPGVLALILIPLLVWKIAGPITIWIWNIVGIAMLVNLLIIGVRSAPGSWQSYFDQSTSRLTTTTPGIWILFSIMLALLGHILLTRKLLTSEELTVSANAESLSNPV